MSLLVIFGAVLVVCFVISVALMWHAARRPMSDEDRALARVDAELERAEVEARIRRRQEREARSKLYPGGGWRG